MPYCPYTDKDLLEDETNSEHIIPLSLGGTDGFEIPVQKDFNSKSGSKIDGALANDFWILGKRARLDVRGHSNKVPILKFKRATNKDTNKPIQITFDHKNGTGIWCPISKKPLFGKISIESQLIFKRSIELRFAAKVFLSSGYYCYGDLFRNHVNHEEARIIMNSSFEEMTKLKLSTKVDDRFSSDNNETLQTFRAVCEFHKTGSIIGLTLHDSSIGMFVGILGIYIGVLNVPANTALLPNSDDYDLGHIMLIENGQLHRESFRSYLQWFLTKIEKI